MRMIRPKLDTDQVTIAEDQEEFKSVTAAVVRHPSYAAVPTDDGPKNGIVLAFRPTEEERQQIIEGADIYVSLLTFMRPMQGIIVTAGPEAMASIYRVPVEKS